MDHPAGVSIRPATNADLPEVLAIAQSAPEASHWSADGYLDYDCLVAEVEGGVIGFVSSRRVAEGEFEILNTAVAPEFRGRGVGSALLEGALNRQPGRYFLEVRPSNSAARNLYKRLGFVEVGLRPNYYETPREHAIVMVGGS